MKKAMFRPLAGLTAAAVVFSLAGCGPASRAGNTHTPVNATRESAPAGALELLAPGNDQGMYTNFIRSDGAGGWSSLRCWVDYGGAVETILCAQPNCTHDSDACTAWIDPEVSESSYALGGDMLCAGYGMDTMTLTLRKGDGSDPKVLYESASYLSPRMTDGEWLYFEQETANGESPAANALYRVPLSGGEAEKLFDLPYPVESDAGLLGCTGREAIFYTFHWGDDDTPMPEMTDGMTQEEYDAAVSRWAESQQGSHRIYAKNVDTGAERELAAWNSALGSAGSTCAMAEGTIYLLPDRSLGELTAIDPATGESTTTAVAWPFDIPAEEIYTIAIKGTVEGKVIADVTTLEGGDRRAAIDPADGSARELTLHYISNGHVKGIRILGQGGGKLLVCYEQRMEDAVAVGSDGMTFVGTDVNERWAMIDAADFLADDPAYQDLQSA